MCSKMSACTLRRLYCNQNDFDIIALGVMLRFSCICLRVQIKYLSMNYWLLLAKGINDLLQEFPMQTMRHWLYGWIPFVWYIFCSGNTCMYILCIVRVFWYGLYRLWSRNMLCLILDAYRKMLDLHLVQIKAKEIWVTAARCTGADPEYRWGSVQGCLLVRIPRTSFLAKRRISVANSCLGKGSRISLHAVFSETFDLRRSRDVCRPFGANSQAITPVLRKRALQGLNKWSTTIVHVSLYSQ